MVFLQVIYGEFFICSDNPALGRVGPSSLVLDGQSLIDVAQFVNAANTTVFARGRGPRELSFTVWAVFNTVEEALNCFLTHEDELALQADLKFQDETDADLFTMEAAAGQVRAAQLQGVAVRLEYKFTGAKFVAAP